MNLGVFRSAQVERFGALAVNYGETSPNTLVGRGVIPSRKPQGGGRFR